MKQISFEKLKQIAEEYALTIAMSLTNMDGWNFPALACLASVKCYLRDGTVTSTRDQEQNIICSLRDAIRSIDVRMVGDLVELLKLGGYGTPAWVLSGPLEVSLEDEGWIVRRAS